MNSRDNFTPPFLVPYSTIYIYIYIFEKTNAMQKIRLTYFILRTASYKSEMKF